MAEEVQEKHKIVAKIFSLRDGYFDYDDVKAIKIIDRKYNILIMEDYMPVIGEVHGTVAIATSDNFYEFKDITAYYKHSHNEFELLITEFKNV